MKLLQKIPKSANIVSLAIKMFASIITIALSSLFCLAQQVFIYKQIDTTQLSMEVYSPVQVDSSINYPAMIFFFGGGWVGGNRSQFKNHAQYFSKRGIVCFLVDYRTKNQNNTTPFESLKDAKSAIRFLRKNANKFHIDTTKIIAAGGSAGGHLAAAAALIEDYNEHSDDRYINHKPNALVLFNPVIDNGPGGYGYERIGDEFKNFSPLHNIKKGAPPTIIFLGTKDNLVPVETAEYYKKVMEKVESRCELKLYEEEVHGFFNYKNFEYYKKTLQETDAFLQSLNYLKKEPKINIE
jgi:acetyl esterase